MASAKEVAQKILSVAREYGWAVTVRGSILTITKEVHGRDDFVRADGEYYSILELLPTTSAGSVWGTDGGGIGALTCLDGGTFRMNKSGGSKRVLNALKTLLG